MPQRHQNTKLHKDNHLKSELFVKPGDFVTFPRKSGQVVAGNVLDAPIVTKGFLSIVFKYKKVDSYLLNFEYELQTQNKYRLVANERIRIFGRDRFLQDLFSGYQIYRMVIDNVVSSVALIGTI